MSEKLTKFLLVSSILACFYFVLLVWMSYRYLNVPDGLGALFEFVTIPLLLLLFFSFVMSGQALVRRKSNANDWITFVISGLCIAFLTVVTIVQL